MGLDSVELVIAVEEEFGIEIPNHSASSMVTVGHLVDHVHAAVRGIDPERELEEWAKMDAYFVAVIGREVSGLPMETKVVDLLDEGRKLAQWDALDLLPIAERPVWLRRAIAVVSALVGLSSFWLLSSAPVLGLAVGVVAALAAVILLDRCTSQMRELPSEESQLTIGGLAWWRSDGLEIPRVQIFDQVANIVALQLSVKREEVRDGSRFVEDLGMA